MSTPRRLVALAVAFALLFPSFAAAQAPRAGVVTTLEGNVTARRVALPDPVPLKFKDDVFLQDTITTGDKSLARMLLGGKAVVTVRERTVLTITEIPGKSTIDVQAGKFALAVAREKMRPGEEILIRTPNAVAGVRGTVVVTEVTRQTAQAGGSNVGVHTSFYVLKGTIVAQQLDALTRQPLGAPMQVATLQGYLQAGSAAGRLVPVPREQVGQITSGLQPVAPKSSGGAGQQQVKTQAVETAVTLAAALTGGGDSQQAFLMSSEGLSLISLNDSSPVAPIIPNFFPNTCSGGAVTPQCPATLVAGPQPGPSGEPPVPPPPPEEVVPPPPPPPPPPPAIFPIVLSGTIDRTDPTPIASGDAQVVVVPTGDPLITVSPGAEVTLASPLANVQNSVIVGAGNGLDIRGKLTSTSLDPLLDIDPSIISVVGNFVSVIGTGAELTLAGPLLRDVGGLLISGAGTETRTFFVVQDGGVVRGTSSDPFISLINSTVLAQGSFFSARRPGETPTTVELAGPFLNASGANILAFSTALKDQSGASRLCCSFFGVGQGANLTSTTTLPLVSLDASFLTLGQHAFVFFDTTSIFGEPTVTLPGTVTLAGPLVQATGGTGIAGLADFLGIFRYAVSSTSTDPLITLDGSSVTMGGASPFSPGTTTAGRFLDLSANTSLPATLTLNGPLLTAVNSTITTTDDVFGVFNGASLTSATTSPLITVNKGAITAGRDGSFFIVSSGNDTGSRLSLSGPLLDATDTVLSNGTPGAFTNGSAPSFISFRDNALVTSFGSAPFVSLTRSTVDTAGNFFDVRRYDVDSGAFVLLFGPLLNAKDSSTIDVTSLAFGPACCNLVRLGQGATLLDLDPAALPFITLENSTVNAGGNGQPGGNIVRVADVGSVPGDPAAPSTMFLTGPLLKATGSTVTSLFNTVSVERSALVSASADPFIELTSSSLTAGGLNPLTDEQEDGRLALVISSAVSGTPGDPSALVLSGSLLKATNSSVSTTSDLIGVFNGGLLSTGGEAPLVSLTGTNLTIGSGEGTGYLINIQGTGDVQGDVRSTGILSAGLLAIDGGQSSISGGFVLAANGGQLVSGHPTAPLVSIAGGTHTLGQSALNLIGRPANTAFDTESGLTLGTDEPLRHTGTGAFIDLSRNVSGGAVLNAPRIASLDTALLDASAPLLKVNGVGTSMTATASGIDLVQKAKLTTPGPLFQVNAGVLNINGNAVQAMGGSFLKIGGDLFHITGGGAVNITNGSALFASAGSVVNIAGGILNFANSPGTFSLTNAPVCSGPSCLNLGGIKILLQNNASPANVSVTNAIKNAGSATVNIPSNAAVIVVNGPNTKVSVGGGI